MARDVKITVSGETSAYEKAMRGIELRTRKTTQFIKSSWMGATAAVYAGLKQWEGMQAAARADQEAAAFRNMAASYGESGDRIIAKLREVSANTVDTATLIQKAGTAMMMGIAPDKLERLMAIARATSKLTGQNVTKAFEDISLAVGRQSRMILDNLGIIVKVGEANKAYAASLGKSVEQLTDAEKKQAFLNAALTAGEDLMKRMGKQTRTTAEWFQSMDALVKNLYVSINKYLIKVVKWIVMAFTQAGAVINHTFEEITQGWAYILKFIGRMPGGEFLGFKALGEKAEWLAGQFRQARKEANRFTLDLLDLDKAQPVISRPIPSAAGSGAPAAGDMTAYYKAQLKEWNKVTDDFAAAEKTAWKKITDDYLRSQAALSETVARYQAEAEASIRAVVPNMADELDRALADPDKYFGEIKKTGEETFKDLSNAMSGWARNWSATLNDMVWGAKTSFGDILESFGRMVTQMMIQKSVIEPLTSSVFEPLSKSVGGFFKGIFQHRAAGGPVYAGRPYVVGERGPELFFPGRTGAIAPSAGGVTVNIINNTPSRVEAREGYSASGGKRLDILIDEAVAQRIGAGGKTFQAIRRTFGINPPAFGR